MNYWVKYLENRNNLDDHFYVFRNHLDEHFDVFGLYECERLTLSKYNKRLHFQLIFKPAGPQEFPPPKKLKAKN